jgi:glutathione S-transferase
MKAKLYVAAASHPCFAVKRAMELKGIAYKRVEWPPTLHVPLQRIRFKQGTVPGLIIDGEKMIGSRAIMHRLDEIRPEPSLYPADPELRTRVEAADLFGDEVLQSLARRVIWWAVRRCPAAITSYGEDSRLPIPDFATVAAVPLVTRIEWRMNDVSDESTKRDLQELPGYLDTVDSWIAEGLIGGTEPNAPDLQIGASIASLNTHEDLRPMLAGRPSLELATRQFSDFPGRMPQGTLPAEWMPSVTRR